MSPLEGQTEVLQAVFHHLDTVQNVTSEGWLHLFERERFTAAIFDCDGTLVESSDAHMKSMQAAAQEQNFEMAKDWYLARTGLDRQSLFQEFRASNQPGINVERASKASIARFHSFSHLVKPKDGVIGFAKSLKARGVSIAVATNAERNVAEASLKAAGARALFDLVVSISDGIAPKPSPEIFILAAEGLGIARQNILVIEDSPQGVQAAKDARMSVIQLI